ncbi:MAG: amidase [SAR202 cluster bacterium]|nr:amidase [SAR202 cluster bacterium]
MVNEIVYMDAAETAERIRAKDVSPVEVARAHLERIESVNPKLNAIVTHAPGVEERAREAEAAIMRGEVWGPLHGVPYTIKDCVDTAGIRTTQGSRLFADNVPSEDATVVKRLKAAGGIMLGKTNMPEFAFWWETGNAIFGFTDNPYKKGYTAGGSSGGEAAAIATGMSPLGIGSDVGGSIRLPAGHCGVVGLKPTHGRVPLTGHHPNMLLRYMHVGPMARSVRDIALAMEVIEGPDGIDSYCVARQQSAVSSQQSARQTRNVPASGSRIGRLPTTNDQLPLRVAWCAEGGFDPVDPAVQATVRNAAKALADAGCAVEEVGLEWWRELDGQTMTLSIYSAEGTQYLAPIIKGREELLAPPMQRRLKMVDPTFEDYLKANADVDRLRARVAELFRSYDILLLPTCPLPPLPHDTREPVVNGRTVHPRSTLRLTVPFDLTGSPAVSLPFGWTADGLPIGVQLVGRHWEDGTVLQTAAALEVSAERRIVNLE